MLVYQRLPDFFLQKVGVKISGCATSWLLWNPNDATWWENGLPKELARARDREIRIFLFISKIFRKKQSPVVFKQKVTQKRIQIQKSTKKAKVAFPSKSIVGLCKFDGRESIGVSPEMKCHQKLKHLNPRKLTWICTQNDGLEKVTPFKHANFWYLC